MVATLKTQVPLKSTADQYWKAITESSDLFPKILPDRYKSISIIEGDGKSVGTVREIKYSEGTPLVTFGKEKIVLADEANRTVKYDVIEGQILQFFKVFSPTLSVVPSEDGKSSTVNWDIEYEIANQELGGDPVAIQELSVHTFKALDDYVQGTVTTAHAN